MIEAIPAIDLIGGKCVRLSQGDYAQQTTYHDDPLEAAQMFEAAGFRKLHLVDLDGAREKRIVNHKTLAAIVAHTKLQVDFGGGIQSDHDLETAFGNGAVQVSCGSIAVKNRPLFRAWLEKHGAGRFILAADTKGGQVAVSGWQESSGIALGDFVAAYVAEGISYLLCTDIEKDGMLQGPSVGLYQELARRFPSLNIIASGGVSSMADMESLDQAGLYAAVVGKAIYEGKISLESLARYVPQC